MSTLSRRTEAWRVDLAAHKQARQKDEGDLHLLPKFHRYTAAWPLCFAHTTTHIIHCSKTTATIPVAHAAKIPNTERHLRKRKRPPTSSHFISTPVLQPPPTTATLYTNIDLARRQIIPLPCAPHFGNGGVCSIPLQNSHLLPFLPLFSGSPLISLLIRKSRACGIEECVDADEKL